MIRPSIRKAPGDLDASPDPPSNWPSFVNQVDGLILQIHESTHPTILTHFQFDPPPHHQADFLGEIDHFIHALKEGLKSLVSGLELRTMDNETRDCYRGLDTRNFTQVRGCITFKLSFTGFGMLTRRMFSF